MSPKVLVALSLAFVLQGASPRALGQSAPPIDPHAANPHGTGMRAPAPGIELTSDPGLAAGDVVVTVLASGHTPLAGAVVTLEETVQNIAEGNATREQRLETGADGSVTFRGVDVSVRALARVTVRAKNADYFVDDFRPSEKSGHRITVPVFEATSDPSDALVGMRGFVYIQLREGELVFDVLFRVFSLGQKTWIPTGVRLGLPSGLLGFDTSTPRNVERDGDHGARVSGSFPPGQKDIRLSFRFPAGNSQEENFRFALPPHVAEMRVITEYAPGMTLDVPGFEPVQEARGPEGTRVLVTRKALVPGSSQLASIDVGLRGLPTVGPERWYAVVLALGLSGVGLWFARRPGRSTRLGRADLDRARKLLLEDLAALEAAREAGEVGPQTYERARRELILALARLEAPEPAQEGEPEPAS